MRPSGLALILAGALAPSLLPTGANAGFDLPQGPGRDLVYGNCQTCHDLQSVVDSAGITRDDWNALLDNMHEYGLRVDAERRAKILNYLATYMGPNPPKAPAAPEAKPTAGVDGAKVFVDVCAACHQPDAKGKAKEFPPLAGNHDLFLSREFPAKVVLHGIAGPIEVEGQKFNNAMPAFDFLSDAEIAAAIDYVRTHFGNDKLTPAGMAPLTPTDIAELRKTKMTDAEVHTLRKSLEH